MSDPDAQAAKTLIDGYNLMYAAGIASAAKGPAGLERCRLALLNFLVDSLPQDDLPRTVIVFDANRPPPGAKRALRYHGLLVRFAAKHEDADALIETLIAAHSAPRRLTVVSSDHRLHRAARRRRAKAVDSDVWYDELVRHRQQPSTAHRSRKPATPLPAADIEYWLREFGNATPPSESSPLDEFSSPFPPGYCDDLLDEQP